MATLTVWKFDDAGAAEQVREQLGSLQKQELITVHDAAVVTWPDGAKKPKTKQAFSTAGAGAASGAFWGMLFGLIFFVPLFGMAFGAAMGALSGSLTDFGIDDDFIDSVRDSVTEGTSALFLMSSDAVVDRIHEQVDLSHAELIRTNLSVEDEEALREAFAE
ncbi:DUF1269 domain-containing protein [Salsipaludibacter albus]|uniref:DUF1269 domain-containing protein n=1 Tax=Salsipaludibacter albus TaxID=2849650 RepID=UPI001EE3A868|nr:DUF1269 domain-containing protein [Salsipaludibacter albus]MBY5163935.1 DUF1269 domain-containing protein [Salsipaludibacter albus]